MERCKSPNRKYPRIPSTSWDVHGPEGAIEALNSPIQSILRCLGHTGMVIAIQWEGPLSPNIVWDIHTYIVLNVL